MAKKLLSKKINIVGTTKINVRVSSQCNRDELRNRSKPFPFIPITTGVIRSYDSRSTLVAFIVVENNWRIYK